MTAGQEYASIERFQRDNDRELKRFARWVCMSTPLDSEDVLGQSWVKIIDDWAVVCGSDDRDVLNQVLQIMFNTASAMKRKQFRILEVEQSSGHTTDMECYDRGDRSSQRMFERLSEAESLERLLGHVSEFQRRVMVLRGLGRTFAESASILDCSYDEVRGAFYRGRKKIEDSQGGEGDRDD